MTKYTCPKCLGAKVITAFSHIEHGVCFTCAGNGFLTTKPRDKGRLFTLTFIDRETNRRVVLCGVTGKNEAEAIKKGNSKINTKFYVENSAAVATEEEVAACREAA